MSLPGRWWRPPPPEDPGPAIGAGRAYLEALGVYALFFLPSILAAGASLAGVNDTTPDRWWLDGPAGLQEAFQAVLAVGVVVLLAARRSRGPAALGFEVRQAHGGPGLSRALRMAAWAALALVVGSIVTSALATGSFPAGSRGGATTFLNVSLALQAGVVEETVVLAFLVTTLEQARRPRAEILAVAVLCRMAYHIYYGPGVVGILLWAVAFVWLFWRFRSIVPLVLVHVCWDGLIFLSRVNVAFSGMFVAAILGLFVVGPVLWLVARAEAKRGAGPTGPWSGPGASRVDWGPPVGG